MSTSFNLLVKTFLRRFNNKTVNYIRSSLNGENEPNRRLKIDSRGDDLKFYKSGLRKPGMN